jgi:hypothetical protein
MWDKDSNIIKMLYESIYNDSSLILLEAVDEQTAINTIIKRTNVPRDVAKYLFDINRKFCLWLAIQLNKKPEFKNLPPENKLNWIKDNVEEQIPAVISFLNEGSKLKGFNIMEFSWEDALNRNYKHYNKQQAGDNEKDLEFFEYVQKNYKDFDPNRFFKKIKEGIKGFSDIPDKLNWFKEKFEFSESEKNVEEFLKNMTGKNYFWFAKTIKEMPEYQKAPNKLPFVQTTLDRKIDSQGRVINSDIIHNISGWMDDDRRSKFASNPFFIKPLTDRKHNVTGDKIPDLSAWDRAAAWAQVYMNANAPGAGYLELPAPGEFLETYKNSNAYQQIVKSDGEPPKEEILKEYPNGMFWVNTNWNPRHMMDKRSKDSMLLGHCGSETGIVDPDTKQSAYNGSALWSLRGVIDIKQKDENGNPILDKDGNPVVKEQIKGYCTVTINKGIHAWWQLKCKNNSSVYNTQNEFIIPYIVDIFVQEGIYRQGQVGDYADFKFSTIVDNLEQNSERYKNAEEYMHKIKKMYSMQLLKDRVNALATNYSDEAFGKVNDDVKEAYIESGYSVSPAALKLIKPELKELYLSKIVNYPDRCSSYVMSLLVQDHIPFNQIDEKFLNPIIKNKKLLEEFIETLIKAYPDFENIPLIMNLILASPKSSMDYVISKILNKKIKLSKIPENFIDSIAREPSINVIFVKQLLDNNVNLENNPKVMQTIRNFADLSSLYIQNLILKNKVKPNDVDKVYIDKVAESHAVSEKLMESIFGANMNLGVLPEKYLILLSPQTAYKYVINLLDNGKLLISQISPDLIIKLDRSSGKTYNLIEHIIKLGQEKIFYSDKRIPDTIRSLITAVMSDVIHNTEGTEKANLQLRLNNIDKKTQPKPVKKTSKGKIIRNNVTSDLPTPPVVPEEDDDDEGFDLNF